MSEPEITPDDLHTELTAYLDGELDSDSVRRVEEQLAQDPAYRLELQRLERAWDLLDRLPRSSVNETFAKTTIEMVAIAAADEAVQASTLWPRRSPYRFASAIGLVAAGLFGFVIGHYLWPNPNQQLLRDLPVLENFERYYQADNIDFLHMLDQQGLFSEGEGDHAG